MSTLNLDWLIGDNLSSAANENGIWVLRFNSGSTLSIECMWRTIENGVLSATSFDHGQQFGLPEPFDCIAVLAQLKKFKVSAVTIREGTADINLHFGDTLVLEVVSTSAGYESWSAKHPKLGTVFASSGGELNAIQNV